MHKEMPLCVDDWQLTPTKILSRNDAGHSLTRASIYHAKYAQTLPVSRSKTANDERKKKDC